MRDSNLLCRSYAQQLKDEREVREKLLAEEESMKDDWYWQVSLASTERIIKRLEEDIANGKENPAYLEFVKGKEKKE